MYKYKKITVLLLNASIIAGLLPAHAVSAESESAGKITLQSTTEVTTEPSSADLETTTFAASEQTTAETVTGEPVTTEQTTTKQTDTEQTVPEPAAEEQTTVQQTEAATTSNSIFKRSTLSPVKAKTIVIDPGHCPMHPGASYGGFHEEDIALDIANACKAVLDKYGDINVSMTRSGDYCCESIAPGSCLTARNYYAKALRADFLVSMHINAEGKSGANVLVPYKSGYNNSVRKEARKFGLLVLSELQNLGIKNDGFLLRRSTDNSRYKNGNVTDYYSIVRRGVKLNIPSVIIEHGYIDVASDRKFFNTKKKRTKIGKADARAIISYFNLSQKTISGSFVKEGKNTYYVTKKSKKVTGWVKSDGKWYYFDPETGKMKTGFVTIGKKTFYLKPSTGEMAVGWFKVKGAQYFSRGNGTLVKGRKYSDGYYTYKFGAKGKLKKVIRK